MSTTKLIVTVLIYFPWCTYTGNAGIAGANVKFKGIKGSVVHQGVNTAGDFGHSGLGGVWKYALIWLSNRARQRKLGRIGWILGIHGSTTVQCRGT
jgi:hypothetical protein